MIKWKIDKNFEKIFSVWDLNRFIEKNKDIKKDIVRNLKNRITCRIFTPPEYPDIFVKTFNINSLQFFIEGVGEWEKAKKLYSLEIDSYEIIALGVENLSLFKKKIYIVTEEIKGAFTLQDYCSKTGFSFSRETVIAFARFIKEIHQKGVFHKDIHWKNIMIEEKEDPKFFLIDTDKVLFKKNNFIKDVISNLALLNLSFDGKINKKYQILFLNEYFRNTIYKKKIAEKIAAGTIVFQNIKRIKLLKRYCSENKYFAVFKRGNISGCYRKGYKASKIFEIIENWDEIIKKSTCIKNSKTTSVFLNKDNGYFIKKYNYKGLLNALKNSLFYSRAKRAWIKSNSLFDMDISTPKPLFYLEKKNFGIVKYSVFSTEIISDAQTLKIFYENELKDYYYRAKQNFSKELAAKIRGLHERGVYHGDMKEKNILISKEKNIFFADCDSIKFFKKNSYHTKCKDIARLNVSLYIIPLKLKLKFLKAYLYNKKEEKENFLKMIMFFSGIKN